MSLPVTLEFIIGVIAIVSKDIIFALSVDETYE